MRWYRNRTTAIKEQNQSSPKVTRNNQLWTFSIFFQNCQRSKFSTDFLHYIRVLYVQWHHNCLTGIWGTKPKVVPEWPKKPFLDSFKFLIKCSYDSKEVSNSASPLYQSPLCAMVSKSYGWDKETEPKVAPMRPKSSQLWVFIYFETRQSDSNENFDSHSKSHYGPLFAMTLYSQIRDNFLCTVLTIQTKFFTVILHHIKVLIRQWHRNRMSGICQT